MTVLATLIVLGVLIFVHELGHFWAARSVGIRVERFSIGLGPKVFGFVRGETEYVISAIPLGGYVKMGGMEDEVMDAIEGGGEGGAAGGAVGGAVGGADGESPGRVFPEAAPVRDSSGDYDSKPVWARAWVISAGVIMNMLFALVAYSVVAAGWGSAEFDTLRVGEVRVQTLPAGTEGLSALPTGATILEIGGVVPEHWGEVRDALLTLPAGPVVLRYAAEGGEGAGSLQFLLPESPEDRAQLVRAVDYWTDPEVLAVTPGSPADRGGIQPGDLIQSVDGVPVLRWSEFTRAVQARPGVETGIRVLRQGVPVELDLIPETVEGTDIDSGELRTIGRVGVLPKGPEVRYVPVGTLEALSYGAAQTRAVTAYILGFLRDLVTGKVSPRSLGSIVTIGEASGQAAAEGLPVFLSFMALLSINLAILNLLPIPVLDGGHLVFLGIEAVRGRPVSVQQRARWSQFGFFVLLGIMALALGNDFLRLFGF
jgi:regulator of sigma E protease